jgi:carbamate kinase
MVAAMFVIQTDTQAISATLLKQSAAISKVVVREKHSALYLSETGSMTPDIEKAKRFDSDTVALLEAIRLKLQAVEIVLLP